MAARTQKFTDRQRAEVFVLDRALCSYSGKSLWLLDFGAAPSSVDWVDHIKPAAKGGTADIENGACASWLYNWAKRDGENRIYLFKRGKPTEDFFTYHGAVSETIAEHLRRFVALHWSDWYFNRAIFCVLIAANQHGERRVNGERFTRDRDYWAKRALYHLERWSEGTVETVPFHSRNLLPEPLEKDHKVLLELTSASSITAVKKIITWLTPYARHNWLAMQLMAHLKDSADARAFMKEVVADPYVVPRVKKVVKHNVQLLYPR